jgi:membrane associated rhomboid family serine protease
MMNFIDTLNEMKHYINRILNRRIYFFYLTFFIISFFMFLLSLRFPWIIQNFSVSINNPWGVITSFFIHLDFLHFIFNMLNIFVLLYAFSFCNSFLNENDFKVRYKAFLNITIISAMSSNIVWMHISNSASVGASGIVYGLEGVLIIFCLLNGFKIIDFIKKDSDNVKNKIIILSNIIIFFLVFGQIFLDVNTFFNYGENISVPVHGYAFIVSVMLTVFWMFLRLLKNTK